MAYLSLFVCLDGCIVSCTLNNRGEHIPTPFPLLELFLWPDNKESRLISFFSIGLFVYGFK